jgi:hypothetical protein
MCIRCERFDAGMAEQVKEHTEQCREEHPARCFWPVATEDYRSSALWLLGAAWQRCHIVVDRIEKSKELFPVPDDIPESVIRDWEDHALRAAELFARARMTAARRSREREEQEGAHDRGVQ